jgi:hypothetical protein
MLFVYSVFLHVVYGKLKYNKGPKYLDYLKIAAGRYCATRNTD